MASHPMAGSDEDLRKEIFGAKVDRGRPIARRSKGPRKSAKGRLRPTSRGRVLARELEPAQKAEERASGNLPAALFYCVAARSA